MNAKISGFVICFEAIICLLLHILHECTFKKSKTIFSQIGKEGVFVIKI